MAARKPKAKIKAAPKKHGRPTRYTEVVAEEICKRLSEGESLRSVCRGEDMPHESTVRSWAMNREHPFSTHYAHARERGYLSMAEELLEIADDASNDWMERHDKDGNSIGWVINGDHVQRSRLRVDTRKWVLSKMLPKIYGDKIVQELTGKDGGPIETKSDISPLEMARRVAFLLRAGVADEPKPA